MDNVANLSAEDRADVFKETSLKKGIVPAVVEKDFWVCWVLGKLFESESLSKKLLFKGGTSLSKVFGLIERFSEDIDLILNWDEIIQQDPYDVRSKTQQDKFNKAVVEKGCYYIQQNILPEINKLIGNKCELKIEERTPDTINIRYPVAFSEDYLRPEIRLEIGPLALWCPNDQFEIQSYTAEEFPSLFEQPCCKVNAVIAERTFWEKATILHHEAYRAQDKQQPQRYSRHYYDMARMASSSIKDKALKRPDLLKSVVEFKNKFYPQGWARYDLAVPGSLKLIPPDYLVELLKKDYKDMQVMIYGKKPSFDDIIKELLILQNEINQ
ncbi:MAG: nucleotidyl transferase AbiEii/AbiGii toxin family protein [Sedimentisphaeraceae bacterium JB056]